MVDDGVRRLPRRGHGLFRHGPVAITARTNVELVELRGTEESDLLHAAGTWMVERPWTVLLALDWVGDTTEDDAEAEFLLRMYVEHSGTPPGSKRE